MMMNDGHNCDSVLSFLLYLENRATSWKLPCHSFVGDGNDAQTPNAISIASMILQNNAEADSSTFLNKLCYLADLNQLGRSVVVYANQVKRSPT